MTLDPLYLPHYTVTDYERWEGQWELIDGIPYAMAPAPNVRHQLLSGRLLRYLDESLEDCPDCLAIMEAEWRIREDTVVIPDVAVICYSPGDYLTQAPKLICEVVSPSSHLRDEKIKFELYAQEGVLWYVLVYPDLPLAKIYRLQNGHYRKVRDIGQQRFAFDLNGCQAECDFGKVFGISPAAAR